MGYPLQEGAHFDVLIRTHKTEKIPFPLFHEDCVLGLMMTKSSLGRTRGRTTAFNIFEYGAECLKVCINAHALAQRERVWRNDSFLGV